MKIIQPLEITPATMQAGDFLVRPDAEPLIVQVDQVYQVYPLITNIPEDDAPLWDEEATYAETDEVMHEHRVYMAAAENTGVEPGKETEFPHKWVDMGVTNRWKMFDEKVGTVTTNPESIEFSVTPNSPVDAVAFFDVDASAVEVTVYDAATGIVAHRQSAPVLTDGIGDWYAYFFSPIELRRDFVLSDLPASTYYSLDVRLLKPGGTASAGAIVMGRTFKIGTTLQGSGVGIIDYSRKERDAFGNSIVVERAFSKRADFDILMDTRDTGPVQRLLAKYRAKPLVWIGHEEVEATILYGYYKDFSIVIGGPQLSDCSITVEGLT